MKATSAFPDDRPDTDSPLQEQTRKPPGTEKIGSISDQISSAPPIVKPKAKRTRKREKNFMARDPSELKELDPKWLDLPEVEAEGTIEETMKRIVVQAHTKFDPMPPCTHCDSNTSVTKWSIRTKPRNIRDSERNTKLVLIVLIVQRYFCNSCNQPFTPRLAFLAGGNLSRTKRLSSHTQELTLQRRTTTDIAVLTGQTRRIVQLEAQELAKTLPTPQEFFLRVTSDGRGHVIQIDNAHPSLGECTSILLDGKPFWLLPAYNEDIIAEFFRTLDVKGRENVTCYISDLAGFLLRIGREFFPNAIVVADPHHVVRRLQLCFDKFLKLSQDAIVAEYITAIDDKRIVRPPRRKRKRVKSPQENLSKANHKEEQKKPTFAEIQILLHTRLRRTTQVQRKALKLLLKRFPSVRAAYCYMQRVMRLYHTSEIDIHKRDASGLRISTKKVIKAKDASVVLDRFEAKLPEHVRKGLRKFLRSCRKNRDVICAFWPTGWTNAEMESQNSVINGIDSAGRGVEFEELRRRFVHGESLSVILKRADKKVLNKTEGPQKKSIRELKDVPPPEPVPIMGPGGQQSFVFDYPRRTIKPQSNLKVT